MARILVVDDHPSMRGAVRALLEGERYEVEEASDGAAALAAITEDPPDLILLDLQVPGLGGLDLLEALRADPARAAVPVVVMTATGDEGRPGAIDAGAADYLTKPFNPGALLQAVERVLGARGSPAT
jgi:two-component system KDP operon response regulator KdpE